MKVPCRAAVDRYQSHISAGRRRLGDSKARPLSQLSLFGCVKLEASEFSFSLLLQLVRVRVALARGELQWYGAGEEDMHIISKSP